MSVIDKVLKIKCGGEEFIDLDDMHWFQGKLKSITSDKFHDLKESIKKHGIVSPFLNWKNEGKVEISDGHHRWLVLNELKKEGWMIPKLPIVWISATDKKEAAQNLLVHNSRYARMTEESLSDFAIENGLDVSDFEFMDIWDVQLDYFSKGDAEMPELSSDEKSPFQQVAFMLHDSQADIVKGALTKAQQEFGDQFDSSTNENKNSNAIALICQRFIDGEQ